MIPVTKPFSPPIAEYTKLLEGVWERHWFTNNGPLVNELELQLKTYLNLPHLLFLNNGTIALQIAIKALELKGDIITTPFSYVATTSSIVWEGCNPVFVDIDPQTLNIDPTKIEAAIKPNTTAILATHVYGNPCDIDAIQKIADKYKLKVIYDAAHCFGTLYKGKSVFAYGDISTTSFHSTKLFHTVEGGAVFTMNPDLLKKLSYLRNFGHEGPEHFAEVGINGKNSEFHAAMGLCNLKYQTIQKDAERTIF
jgi:dTDP-4-amino-4,6-dideoxygalactose transaminase